MLIVKGQFDLDVKYSSSRPSKDLDARDPFVEVTLLSGKNHETEIPLLALKNSPTEFEKMILADKIILGLKKVVPLKYFG